MPKLRKFRVVNLVYNDTRHIYDETFDFHEGEHGMMLLANGGGKTVLTQMMMQPVIPKTDLKTRKFADYFKNNRRPTLLMSEWQLDDDAGILLTGLVIKHRLKKKRGSDEDKESLEIYAFTIHYHYSETYKIDTVPVTYMDDSGRKTMMGFDAIINELKKHEQKYATYVHGFNWSDSREAKDLYGHKLREYGIIQQEWRDNILKINREEAGLKSFFEDAKTGQTLLKRKILPIIESKIEAQVKDRIELKKLFENHAKEAVKNKTIIENEKLYKQFISESDGFLDKTRALKIAQEKMLEAATTIKGLSLGLTDLKHTIESERKATEEERLENRRQIDRIGLEELCFNYYKKLGRIEGHSNEHQKLVRDYESLLEVLKDKAYEVRVHKATEAYQELRIIRGKVQTLELELNQLMTDNDETDMQLLGEVLALKYEEKIEEIEGDIRELSEEEDDLVESIKAMQVVIEELKNQEKTSQREYDITENKMEEFDQKVLKLNKDNSEFSWEKHVLIGNYEEQHLTDYLGAIEEWKAFQIKEIEGLEGRIEEKQTSIVVLERQTQTNSVEEASCKVRLSHSIESLKNYREKAQQIFDGLKDLLIEETMFFDKGYVFDQIEDEIASKNEAYNHLTIERSITIQLMESLREGRLLSLPAEVEAYLKKHQIDFQYGYEWLRQLEKSDIEASLYMEQINVLPYALVMDDGHYGRFQRLDKSYRLSQVLPVIAESYIRKMVEGSIELPKSDGLMMHTAFEKELLDETYVVGQIDYLSDKIIEIEKNQLALIKGRDTYGAFYNNYNNFIKRYSMDSKDMLEDEVVNLEETLLALRSNSQKALDEMATLAIEIKALRVEEKEASLELDIGIKKQGIYKALLKDFRDYQTHQKLLYKLKKNLDRVIKEGQQCGLDHKNLKKSKEEKSRSIDHKRRDINEIKQHLNSLTRTLTNKVLKESSHYEKEIKTLEIEYDVFNRTRGSIRSVREALEANKGRLNDYENVITELKVSLEDYENQVFEQSLLETAKQRESILRDETDAMKNKIGEKQGEINGMVLSLSEDKEAILRKRQIDELLPKAALVNTNYLEQKKQNKEAHEQLRNTLKDLDDLLREVTNSLEELFDQKIETTISVEAIQFVLPISNSEINVKKRQALRAMNDAVSMEVTARNQVFVGYTSLRSKYYQKNDLFDNMFRHLLNDETIYEFEFTNRVIKQAVASIHRILEKYATDINILIEKERTLYHFVQEKVSNVYDELKDIDKHSIIELNGKREKMLHIDLPSKDSIDLSSLNHYMKDIIRLAKVKIENEDYEELERYLDNHLKLEQLFDEYIPINRIGISIAKIEQNKVSKMSWEKVGKASGGEVFVSVFIMFSSLISYTRGYQLSRKKHGTVLVMDNPFGPVSSEHLLAPLFKIAQTYDTQMICYTHINTSAITNQFDLIYSLRVVQEGGSSREHLSTELAKDKNNQIEVIDTGIFEIGDGDQIGFL